MLLDFNVSKSKGAIEKQRIVTDLITSQKFIEYSAKKAEIELKNEGVYDCIYTHEQDKDIISIKEKNQSKKIKKKSLFKK